MFHRLIRRACLGATAAALVTLLPVPLTAQKFPPPTNVTVQATGSAVTVAWAPAETRGMTYRVLRALDARAQGVDLTKPVDAVSFVDPNVVPGTTYFYQVIAMYGDGTSAAAEPVGFTVPKQAALVAPGVAPPDAAGQRTRRTKPPILTGTPVVAEAPSVTVTGNFARVTLTWNLSLGASSYQVLRSTNPDVGFEVRTPAPISPGAVGPFSFTDEGADLHRASFYSVVADFGPSGRHQSGWLQYLPPNHGPVPGIVGGYWTVTDDQGYNTQEGCVGWGSVPGASEYRAEVNFGWVTRVLTPAGYSPRTIRLTMWDFADMQKYLPPLARIIKVKVGAVYPGQATGDFWHGELVLPSVITPLSCYVP